MIKVECTHCGQLLEGEDELAFQESVNCPSCNRDFVPMTIAPDPGPRIPATPLRSPAPAKPDSRLDRVLKSEAEKIRAVAARFTTAAVVLFFIGLPALFLAIVSIFYVPDPLVYFLASSGLLTWSLGLYVIAQIIHIRANTHK